MRAARISRGPGQGNRVNERKNVFAKRWKHAIKKQKTRGYPPIDKTYEQGYDMEWRLALNMIRGNDKEEFGWGESKCEVN